MYERRAAPRWAATTALPNRKQRRFGTKKMPNPQNHIQAREYTNGQARNNADAAGVGVEILTDFRPRATEDASRSVRGGADAASQELQSVFDQSARTLGFSSKEGERRAQQSVQNAVAITKFGTVLTKAYQDISRAWYALAHKQLRRNLEGLSKLAHCRSVQDFAAVQCGLIRESLQAMVEDRRSIVEISLEAVNDASKVLARTAQERTVQGRLRPLAA